ncbi:aldo/keto reductase [Balneolaceae bacterium ANBcel3]|nr:aldo/keto reductase [Balneolaceae bacterium ANBcel3]
MKTRQLCPDGTMVTECGLGCWQLGGGWGIPWNFDTASDILSASHQAGVRFFDTADVYGDGNGESETSIGAFLPDHNNTFFATKLGRNGIFPDKYSRETLLEATEASLSRLKIKTLPLTQLHCIPLAELKKGDVFDWLREQKENGLIERFGASVETVEEGLVCLEQDGLSTLQVIFNIFRQKPLEKLLPAAKEKGVGIIVRLPLASGLLSGKMTKETAFAPGDHRNFNKDGKVFNVGETFAGLPFEKGLELVEKLRPLVPEGFTMAQMALRWILDHPEVSVVIPGASSPEQARANASISEMPSLPDSLHEELKSFYKKEVHPHIRGAY